MATHSSILAWRWTEEPGGLQTRGSQSQILLSDSTHRHVLHLPLFHLTDIIHSAATNLVSETRINRLCQYTIINSEKNLETWKKRKNTKCTWGLQGVGLSVSCGDEAGSRCWQAPFAWSILGKTECRERAQGRFLQAVGWKGSAPPGVLHPSQGRPQGLLKNPGSCTWYWIITPLGEAQRSAFHRLPGLSSSLLTCATLRCHRNKVIKVWELSFQLWALGSLWRNSSREPSAFEMDLSRVKTGGVVCGDDKNSVKGGGSSKARDKMSRSGWTGSGGWKADADLRRVSDALMPLNHISRKVHSFPEYGWFISNIVNKQSFQVSRSYQYNGSEEVGNETRPSQNAAVWVSTIEWIHLLCLFFFVLF